MALWMDMGRGAMIRPSCVYFVPICDASSMRTPGPGITFMNELCKVLHEVLKALGIEGAETIGLYRGAEPGDRHGPAATAETGGA
jgi:hypothetical protein